LRRGKGITSGKQKRLDKEASPGANNFERPVFDGQSRISAIGASEQKVSSKKKKSYEKKN